MENGGSSITIKVSIIIRLLFALYAIINLVQYILTRKDKDYEGLHTFIISTITVILTFFFDVEKSPNTLAMIMMFWITLMSLTKFKLPKGLFTLRLLSLNALPECTRHKKPDYNQMIYW